MRAPSRGLMIALCLAVAGARSVAPLHEGGPRRRELGVALAGDWVSAFGASALAAPFISTIDMAVMRAAASGSSVGGAVASSVKSGLLRNPASFALSFQSRWTLLVYALTYGASNSAATWAAYARKRSEVATLAGTTALNSASCLAKDAAFARRFGATSAPVPPASLSLFLFRDVLTMACAFVLPAPVAALTGRPGLAQILCPVVAQVLVAGPHLLALDLHNRPHTSLHSRIAFLHARTPETLAFRTLRALPAYGAGVLANKKLRDHWHRRFHCVAEPPLPQARPPASKRPS